MAEIIQQRRTEEEEKDDDLFTKKKIQVNRKEISEDVQAAVADICLSMPNIKDPEQYSEISMQVKKKLDKNFKDGWNVIIGTDFAGSCSVAKNNLLEISISNIRILVFKSSAHISPP